MAIELLRPARAPAPARCLAVSPGARADLGAVDTALGEISFEEVQVAPASGRLAFLSRRNDLEQDRQTFRG